MYFMVMIVVELTCQHGNGGCDQVCSDTETGVNCSCLNGYQLVDNQTCSGIGMYVYVPVRSYVLVNIF